MARRFSEEEAQRIFARVAERQRTLVPADTGLSLEDLEEAARAAGLDPALVASAASELDAVPERGRTIAGAPVEVVRHRVVPGALDDDTWAGMVAAARARFGSPGIAGQIGRLREWTVVGGNRGNSVVTRLAAEPAGDGTRVTLSQSVREPVLGFSIATAVNGALAVLFGVLAASGVEAGLWIPAAILLAMALLFGTGSQVGARIWERRRAADFEALLDRLDLVARDAASAPVEASRSVAPGVTLSEPALDLDALPDPDPDLRREDRARDRS